MKSVFSAFVVFMCLQTANATIYGTIDNIFCGEMDPFVVGDTCITFITTENKKKVALNFNFDEWLNSYSEDESLWGRTISVNHCEKITEAEVVRVLKDYDSSYFYLNCAVEYVTIQ